LPPELNWAHVELVDAAGTVIASQASNAAGQAVMLNNAAISADGTYRVRVKAPAGHLGVTGDYLVSVWDVTPNVRTLNVGQSSVGTLGTPFAVDQWTFTASAGQQFKLDVKGISSSSLAFSLTGPGGPHRVQGH
jgi:hypothetical protein